MEGKATRSAIIGVILLCFGGALIVVSVGFLTFALNTWLRVGDWPDYPLSQLLAELGIAYPRLSWGPGQGLIDWLLSLGACTTFFWTGVLLAAIGGLAVVREDRRQRLDEASA